jgi:hypothetical protein
MNSPRKSAAAIKRGGVAAISPNLRQRVLQPQYCSNCCSSKKGLPQSSETLLQQRIYPAGEPLPQDAKEWRQCYLCGEIVHIIHIPGQGELVSEIEEQAGPYDAIGAGGIISGIEKRKRAVRGKHERSKLEYIKEYDVKEALRKGAKLISYSEH